MLLKTKSTNRLKTISLYSISQLLSFLSVFLFSIFIIKFHSTKLWGEYAELLIWTNFFLLFLGFGSNDYLLKQFSKSPSSIFKDWTINIKSRSAFLILTAIIIYFLPIFLTVKLLIFSLIAIQFFTQSFKILILYHRHFKFSILVDVIYNIALISLLLYFKSNLNIRNLILIVISIQSLKFLFYFSYYYKSIISLFFKNNINFNHLKYAIPFFIPTVIGTIRVKIDAYYGTYFFDEITLSKYQILLNFLFLAQMISAFIINPFLKNIYRLKDKTTESLHRKFFIFGWFFSIILILFTYVVITYIYNLEFTLLQYGFAYLFTVPLFLHLLLINEFYKKNKQKEVVIIATLIVFPQLFIGYFSIKKWNVDAALILKATTQWIIVFLLWIRLNKTKYAK